MLPERIALQMAHVADKPEVGICAGNIQLMNSDGTPYAVKRPARDGFRRLDFDDVFLERKPMAPAPTMLIRHDALEKVGGFNPEIRLEDLYIQLKITHAGYYVDALGTDLARYRIHTTNSHKNIRFMAEAILRIYEDYRDHPAYETVKFKFFNFRSIRPATYTLLSFFVIPFALGPLIYLVVPFAISPAYIPVITSVMLLPLSLLLANSQPLFGEK